MKNCEVKSRELIRSITENSDDYDYDEKYIKLKLDSDNELSLNKMIKFPIIEIVVRAIFLKITNIICKLFQMNVCIKYK